MNPRKKKGALPGSKRAVKTNDNHSLPHADSKVKPSLDRQTFTTSRLLDYFSKKELVLQTGHDREHWPEVDDEIAYLTGDGSGKGQRVELNAMTSPQFINWLERKLRQHGIAKLIPENKVLATAYRDAWLARRMNERIESVFDSLRKEAETVAIPKELTKEVRLKLKQTPTISWDAAVSEIVAKKAEP